MALNPPPLSSSPPDAAPVRWTVLEVIRWTAARFTERALATPRLDAELLVAHALGLPRVQLYVQFDRPLGPDELGAIRALIKRRQAGESVAYLVGKKEFWGVDFTVDARVLVPRPDTETLIEEARERLGQRPPEPQEGDAEEAGEAAEATPPAVSEPPRIADVGTGSGAIALTLAKLFPGAAVFAGDVSPGALEVARGNAERLGLAVTFVEGDLAAPLAAHAPFSLVCANLPYIPSGDMATLPPEVKTEPALALDGGPDGLALVRRLVGDAPRLLAPGGALVLEIGDGQAGATAELLRAAGLADVRVRRDLAGVERVVSGVRA
ncbi:MAG TPA: peptide chain release factor N(5)-glutamine methyltransferase [Polyangia bacterium]|nr:peptide chain release factor N(5)-glutamine methyltransferase [Polyangia bacterium]